MDGRYHQMGGCEFEKTLGVGDGQARASASQQEKPLQ